VLSQQVVDGTAEGFGDIGFPLVAAAGRLAVELAEAQVQIREVGEFQGSAKVRVAF
jgi:hypothetical protein